MRSTKRRRLYGAALVVIALIVVSLVGGSVREGAAAPEPAKIVVTARAAAGATVPGGTAEVLVTISNEATAGGSDASAPSFSVAAPAGFTYAGATNLDRVPGFSGHGTPTGRWMCRAATCSYAGALKPGGTLAVLAGFKAATSVKPGRNAVFRVAGGGSAAGKTGRASFRVVAGPGAPDLYTQATPMLVRSDRPGVEIVDVLNTGPVASTSVQLANLLPALVGSWRATGAGWTCSGAQDAPPACSSARPIQPGQLAAPLRIAFTLDENRVSGLHLSIGGKPSVQNWSVEVTATGGGSTHTVPSPAELAVAPPPGAYLTTSAVAARGLQELLPGGSTTVTVKLANVGGAATEGLALTGQIPTGLSITGASGAGSWDCSDLQPAPTGETFGCRPTAPVMLAPGRSLTVRLAVRVAADAKPGSDQLELAAVSGNPIASAKPRATALPILILEPNAGFPALTLLSPNRKGVFVPTVDGAPAKLISGQPFTERLDVRDAGGAAIAAGATAELHQALGGGATIRSISDAPGWRCSGTTSLDCTVTFGAALEPAASLQGPTVVVTAGAATKATRNWEATIRLAGPGTARAYRLPVLVAITHGVAKLVPNFTNIHVPTAGGTGTFGLGVGNEGNIATASPVQLGFRVPRGVRVQKLVASGWTCVTAATSARCTSAAPLKAGGHLPHLTLHLSFARETGNRPLSLEARATDGSRPAPKTARAAIEVEPRHALRAMIKEPDKAAFADQPLVRAGEKLKPTLITLEGDGSGGSGLGVSYRWTQRSGAAVKWLGPRSEPDVQFTAPQVPKPSTLVFALTVNDGSASDTSTVRIKVVPLPSAKQGFAIRDAHPRREKQPGPMVEHRKLPKPAEKLKLPKKATARNDTPAPTTTTTPTTTSSSSGLPDVFCQLVRDALNSGGSFSGTVGGVAFGFDSVTVSGTDCAAGTTVSFSGSSFSISSVKASGVSGSISASGLTISGGTLTGPEAWHSPTFTLSGGGLTVPFSGGAAALSGTVKAEGFAFVPLPDGWDGSTTLSFGAGSSGTSVSVSTTATGPKSDASPDSPAPVASIQGAVASDGTFSLAVSVQEIVQLAGSAVNLSGSVKRETTGGPITSSFEGSLASPITIVPGLQIAALTVKAAPTDRSLNLSGSGQIELTTPSGKAGVNVDLAYDNPKNWSLTATGTGDASWTPLPGLTIAAKDFAGAIMAKDDAYDLTLKVAPAATWKPSSSVTVTNLALTLSNTCPETGAPCPPSAAVFFDVKGDVAFDLPAIGTVKTTLKGTIALPSGEFSVEAALAEPLSVGAGISIDNAKVMIQRGLTEPSEDPSAETADAGDYRVDLEGGVTVPGIGKLPTVHASFSSAGWAIAVPLGSFSLPGSSGDGSKLGNAVVGWASFATKLDVVDPVTKAVTKIDLPANSFKLSGDFATPSWMKTTLGLSSDVNGRATGTFDPDRDYYALRMDFAVPGQPYLYGNASSATNVKLASTYFEIVRSGGDFNVALGGAAVMNVKGSGSLGSSSVDVGLALSNAVISQTVTGTLSFDSPSGWKNAFGVNDLTLYKLAVQFSFNIPSLTPGVGFGASAVLPSTIRSQLGVTNGARTTLVANISVNNPCLGFQVDNPTKTGQTVLSIGNGALTAQEFELTIAPTGCTVGQFVYAPGVSLEFDGTVANVSLAIKATISLAPFGFDGSASLGEFSVGGLTVLQTKVALTLSSSKLKVSFSGGVKAFGTTVTVAGSVAKSGSNVVSDFTGTLDKLSIGGDALTANNLNVAIHTETGASNVLKFNASGRVTLFGSSADGKFALSLSNGQLNQATADIAAKVNVGGASGLALDGTFHVNYSSTTPLAVNATVSAKAGSFSLGTATVVVNNGYMSVSTSFSVGSVFTASIQGAAYYGTPPSGSKITLPDGSKVNAKVGDFYLSASNISLKVAGFSGTGSFFIGQVGGAFYGNLNGAIQIVGTSGTNTVNVNGTVSGNGDFALNGNAALDLAGFKPNVAVSVKKTGSSVAVSGTASLAILSSKVDVTGDFLYDGGKFLFRLNGTGSLVAGGYSMGTATVAFSNFPADAGLRASVSFTPGGLVNVNGTLNINAQGGFNLNASARIGLKDMPAVNGTVSFAAGPQQRCVQVVDHYIQAWIFQLPIYRNDCSVVNVSPTLTATATVAAGEFSFAVSVSIDGSGNYTASARTPISGETSAETPTISFIVVRGYAYISYHLNLTLRSTPRYVDVEGAGTAGIKFQHWDIEWPVWDSGWSGWKDGGSISASIRTTPSFQACAYISVFGEDIGGCIP